MPADSPGFPTPQTPILRLTVQGPPHPPRVGGFSGLPPQPRVSVRGAWPAGSGRIGAGNGSRLQLLCQCCTALATDQVELMGLPRSIEPQVVSFLEPLSTVHPKLSHELRFAVAGGGRRNHLMASRESRPAVAGGAGEISPTPAQTFAGVLCHPGTGTTNRF